MEAGESAEVALVRELREELGCEVQIVKEIGRSWHTYDRGTIEMIPFISELAEGSSEPQPLEHAALLWVKAEDLANHDLAPADYPVVEAFLTWLTGPK